MCIRDSNISTFLGTNKFNASLPASSLLSEVIKEAEKVTGVPSSSQKLIINGKALTSLDHNKLITECRIQDGTKIMVLGKRYDPESDSLYQKIVTVEQLATETQKKLSEVSKPTCIDKKCSNFKFLSACSKQLYVVSLSGCKRNEGYRRWFFT